MQTVDADGYSALVVDNQIRRANTIGNDLHGGILLAGQGVCVRGNNIYGAKAAGIRANGGSHVIESNTIYFTESGAAPGSGAIASQSATNILRNNSTALNSGGGRPAVSPMAVGTSAAEHLHLGFTLARARRFRGGFSLFENAPGKSRLYQTPTFHSRRDDGQRIWNGSPINRWIAAPAAPTGRLCIRRRRMMLARRTRPPRENFVGSGT